VVQKLFFIFQVAPLSFIFLRFINYWSITSFYILIKMEMPDYLKNCLSSIYKSINDWFFNSLVNIIVSFMISFKCVSIFFITNLVIFAFGIFTNSKSIRHKLNNVVLSCHIFLFNFGFLGMFFFENRSDFMY
jgi:hypothetical protein